MAVVSEKSRLVAFLLCFFLGGFGVHRFYVGKIGTGIAQILTLGGFGIWVVVDWIMILLGVFKDKKGQALVQWGSAKPGAIPPASPVENKPVEPRPAISPSQPAVSGKISQIVMAAVVLAVVVIIAVLVFEVIEFQYYRQHPSIWPVSAQSK